MTDLCAGKLMPDEQVHVFAHTDRFFPTRTVRSGAPVRPIGSGPVNGLRDIAVMSQGERHDLYDYVSRNRVAGMLVLRRTGARTV